MVGLYLVATIVVVVVVAPVPTPVVKIIAEPVALDQVGTMISCLPLMILFGIYDFFISFGMRKVLSRWWINFSPGAPYHLGSFYPKKYICVFFRRMIFLSPFSVTMKTTEHK